MKNFNWLIHIEWGFCVSPRVYGCAGWTDQSPLKSALICGPHLAARQVGFTNSRQATVCSEFAGLELTK